MFAPQEVIDGLESIVGIFFSDLRHKERSVFILCDNLIEICCKIRINERDRSVNLRKLNFEEALDKAKIPSILRRELISRHRIRNDMQHGKLGITVDYQSSADAVMGAVKTINCLWKKYCLDNIPDWLNSGLRIIKLYSKNGNPNKRKMFEAQLRNLNWRDLPPEIESKSLKSGGYADHLGDISEKIYEQLGLERNDRRPKESEIIIPVGTTDHWYILITRYTSSINQCLDQIKVDETLL